MYLLLKHIHVSAVVLTAVSFLVRGFWMWRRSPMLSRRLVRILPHVIDTVLLASAVGLMLMLHQYPFVQPWLTAKVIGLIVYIVCGSLALKRARTQRARLVFLGISIAVFAYILSVAILHNPTGVFALF